MVCLMSIKRFPNKIYTLQFGFKLTIDSDFLMEPLFKASLIALNKGFLLYLIKFFHIHLLDSLFSHSWIPLLLITLTSGYLHN